MQTSPVPPTQTVRDAISAALVALDCSHPAAGGVALARTELKRAIDLLDASFRETGAFREAEPYRLVLDPRPYDAPKLVLRAPGSDEMSPAGSVNT
jgi:hypothetical protein